MKGRNFTNRDVDEQRFQILELHFGKFPSPQTFSCRKMRFKTEVCSCSIFTTEAVLWFKEGDDGSGELRIFAIHSGNYSFSRFSNIGRKNCILHHPEFLLQEEVHSGGTEDSRRRRPIPPWQTHRTSDPRMSARRALTRHPRFLIG